MDNIGEIIGILIFLIISMLTSFLNKSKKKKPAPQKQAPETKKESPLDFLEKIIFEQSSSPEPQFKMDPVIIEDKSPVIRHSDVKSMVDVEESKRGAYEQKAAINKTAKKLRGHLRNPQTIRDLILVHEILGKPKAFKD